MILTVGEVVGNDVGELFNCERAQGNSVSYRKRRLT